MQGNGADGCQSTVDGRMDPNAGIVEAAAFVAKLRSVTEGAQGEIAISQRNRQGYQS
jgi:hypothetical protein